jgi:hypothetical protein
VFAYKKKFTQSHYLLMPSGKLLNIFLENLTNPTEFRRLAR